MMTALYAPFTRNHDRIFYMDVRSAEFTKYAANAMLATRISFMNELANLADCMGADIELVRQGIGSDPRIGYGFLYAGTGYGGSCFPKDVQALMRTAYDCKLPLQVLNAVEEVNNSQKRILVSKIVRAMGEDLSDKTFGMWGLAFKPNTNDMREAPSRVIIAELLKRGASLRVFDPVATEEAKRVLQMDLSSDAYSRITFCNDEMKALQACDALIIVTEWKAFRSPDFDQVKMLLRSPMIFDGRNLYEPLAMREHGFRYFAVGRSLKEE
jgi:UDPglucose 6-dehydrogenase